MTYCFVFNAEPDGIGIIADTRITDQCVDGELLPRPGDALKFYRIRDRAFVAIAGRLDHVAMLLHGVSDAMYAVEPAGWYDAFSAHVERTFRALCSVGLFSEDSPPEAAFIYSDLRHKRGETRCRVLRLEFGLANRAPVCIRRVAPPNHWVAIGWTPEGRGQLNLAAAAALGEVMKNGLTVAELSEAEIRRFHRAPVPGGELRGIVLDTTGPPDRSWRKKFREFANDAFPRGGATLPIEPVLVLCSAVIAAIEPQMARLRAEGAALSQGVGEHFAAASLTQRHGFRVYSHAELRTIPLVDEAISATAAKG